MPFDVPPSGGAMRTAPRRGQLVCLLATVMSACDEPAPFERCTPVDVHPPQPGRPVQLRTVDDPRVRIAFVPEGFRHEETPRAQRRAETLLEAMMTDRNGLLARVPEHVEAWFVPLVSESGDLRDDDPLDSALGTCVLDDEVDPDGRPKLSRAAVEETIAVASPDIAVDIVVVLVDTPGRAHAEGAIIVMPSDDGADTLIHELGHALIGLGDEYASDHEDLCYPGFDGTPPGVLDPFSTPNLTLDPRGTKWADVVDGAREGGGGFGSCVWHPPGACRMKDSATKAWCPVCAHEIDRWVASVRGNDGPPRCEVALVETFPMTVRVAASDLDGLTRVESTEDGRVVIPIPIDATTSTVWNHWPDFTPGSHRVSVLCVDVDGEVSRADLDVNVPANPNDPTAR